MAPRNVLDHSRSELEYLTAEVLVDELVTTESLNGSSSIGCYRFDANRQTQPRSTVIPSGPSVCESCFARQSSAAKPCESHQAFASGADVNGTDIMVT